MAFGGEGKIDYEKNPLIKLMKKFFNFLPDYDGPKFFVRKNKKLFATSLFLTLLLIESSDIVLRSILYRQLSQLQETLS